MWNPKRITLLGSFALLSILLSFATPQRSRIKLATLVPSGSVWDKTFKAMGSDWKRDTSGRVSLKVYPGGVAGDESDIIRKMRIGQLQAASLTVSGLGMIDPAFRVFETPLLFESHEELQYVLKRVTPLLKEKLEAKGFELLHWGHGGWIYIFSKKPITSLNDLRTQKHWVWAGDSRRVQWWKRNGFQPVPLSVPDIPTGLQTGLIEAVPTTPLAALGLQWFRSTPYMLDYGVLPYLGGTVVTEKAWERISEADRAVVLKAAKRAEEHLDKEVPKQEAAAIKEMSGRGVTLTQPKERGPKSDWAVAAGDFTEQVKANEETSEFFKTVVELRDEFRAQHTQQDE